MEFLIPLLVVFFIAIVSQISVITFHRKRAPRNRMNIKEYQKNLESIESQFEKGEISEPEYVYQKKKYEKKIKRTKKGLEDNIRNIDKWNKEGHV